MARQYGGKTGPFQSPTKFSAPGAWFAPTEVFRQRTNNQWPLAFPAETPTTTVGSVVFAVTSGVVNAAIQTGFFVVASGGTLNRTTSSDLFNTIGTLFGAGDAVSTFNVPNLYDKFVYLKGTTVSGTTPVQASGQLGALHTHTWVYKTANFASANRNGGQPMYNIASVSKQATSDVQGTAVQNDQRKRPLIPLVCRETAAWPVGCVIPLLWPSYDGLNFPVSNYLICSGQAVSRTTYSGLYSRLGNHYGAGDGSTTFNIPDLRGLFVSGPSANGMIQPSGSPASFEPDAFVAHRHLFEAASYSAAGGVGPAGAAYSSASSPPPSTSGGLLPNESRAANISIIWALPVV
jgi:microcystin-dependent protein